MLAIERVAHRLGDRAGREVGREHRRPRDGLQRGPVRAGRQDEGEDNQKFSAAREHKLMISHQPLFRKTGLAETRGYYRRLRVR